MNEQWDKMMPSATTVADAFRVGVINPLPRLSDDSKHPQAGQPFFELGIS